MGVFAPAQSFLGLCYFGNRFGLDRDEAKAIEWLRRGAEQGDEYGNYHLGQYYESGEQKNEQMAKAYYAKGCEGGASPI